jgi:hypothetical protein
MTYVVAAYTTEGEFLTYLPATYTIAAARQTMLDHSNTIDLPSELPWHGPDIGVIEGWFIGRTEYLIEQMKEG